MLVLLGLALLFSLLILLALALAVAQRDEQAHQEVLSDMRIRDHNILLGHHLALALILGKELCGLFLCKLIGL